MNPYRHARPGREGSAVREGLAYHDIPGYPGPVHRSGTRERAAQILDVFDVTGKRGLDVGCGPGGITVELARAGAVMVGVDHDPSALAVGREVAELEQLPARFVEGDVVETGSHLLGGVDFVVWLSQYMWAVKQHGNRAEELLALIAERVPVLIFESAEGPGDGMAGAWAPTDVRSLLERHYLSVIDLGPGPGGWEGNRHVFFCHRSVGITGTVASGFGAAAQDVERGMYAHLPYEPYPGTLNLSVPEWSVRPVPRESLTAPGERTLLLWPMTVGGVDGHLVWAEDAPGTVELLAPVRLRDLLDVVDGDQVTVEVRSSPF